MNAFEKWWESDEAFAFRHDDWELQVKQAYIAGLRHAAEISSANTYLSGSPSPLFGAGWNAAIAATANAIESAAKEIEGG